tara:strand:- start:4424 stop:5239 length:816 start_codon:yes stop_codon:yes gene_type:complete
LKVKIIPHRGNVKINFRELYDFRDLLFLLIKRNITVKYVQTIAGLLWAVINPLFQMIIFTFVFKGIAKINTGEIPYAIFSFSGIVPWTLFSNSLSQSTSSLESHKALITKVYFPRLIIPFSSVLSNLFDFFIAFLILFFMLIYFSLPIYLNLFFYIPFLTLFIVILSSGLGCLLTSLSAQYRDVKHGVGLLINIWMYMTPIAYPIESIPEKYLSYYSINPMVGFISTFRSVIFGNQVNIDLLAYSSISTIFLFIFGIYIFNKNSKSFADVI